MIGKPGSRWNWLARCSVQPGQLEQFFSGIDGMEFGIHEAGRRQRRRQLSPPLGRRLSNPGINQAFAEKLV